ncbi:thioredoxin domain-containing protein [Helcococcus bovis]|uniref:thioredoxin domain-containing protein n=1 Tax=Helcococcus bovis TaxID=3153252 RepID=UPI0038B9D04D
MKKVFLICLLIISIVGCSKNVIVGQDGDKSASEYLRKFYDSDTQGVKVDFINYDIFNKLKTQTNDFVIVYSSLKCKYCKKFVPELFKLLNEQKISHVYFMKFDEMSHDHQKNVSSTFSDGIIPTVQFFKGGNLTEFQGEFDLLKLSKIIEDFKKENNKNG